VGATDPDKTERQTAKKGTRKSRENTPHGLMETRAKVNDYGKSVNNIKNRVRNEKKHQMGKK